MLGRIIMFLCSIYYKKYGEPIFYIKGTGKNYPKYLLYTEDRNVYKRMDKF
jgi:hypothetical protein